MAGFIQDKIYPILPIRAQNLAISIFGYFWKKRRFGGVFNLELEKFRSRENFTNQQWEVFQTHELRKILFNAFSNVPFYNEKYSKAGFTLADLKNFNLSDLTKLPFLEKVDLRQFGKSTLLSKKIDKKGAFYSSSGSTGTPTSIYFSVRMHQIWSAIFEARIRNWAGLTYKNPRGMIGGRRVVVEGNSNGPFYRYNFAEKQTYFSAYHINSATVSDYIKGMSKHGVEYMTGYAMSNYFLAKFIEKSGINGPKLKAVITSSEKLTAEMRDTFKRVYGCNTFDSYSGVEACGLISECENGKLHMSPDAGILEVLKSDGQHAQPGETGELICTGLLNFDQPLIRYRIGDVVTLSLDQTCKCGRNMPIVDEIMGRIEDTVVGSDGRLMVRFHGIFVGLPSIVEGQIIQEEVDSFEINVVLTSKLTEDISSIIKERMVSQLGEVDVKIRELEFIPRNQNGKFKAVISKVKIVK
jgi:phenylacetate-CoA ligase